MSPWGRSRYPVELETLIEVLAGIGLIPPAFLTTFLLHVDPHTLFEKLLQVREILTAIPISLRAMWPEMAGADGAYELRAPTALMRLFHAPKMRI